MVLPGADVFERAGLKAWPGIEVEYDGQWIRRWANGYTQRANSVQSLDPGDVAGAAERLEASRRWYEARRQTPIFRVTPLAGSAVVAALDAAGWPSVDASHLFAMELGSIEPDPRGRLHDLLDPEFLAVQQRLQGYADDKLARMRALLSVIDVPARGIVLRADGQPVASALMAVADGIVVTGNVVTDPTQRRKGYAVAMMRTGLAWARAAGARIAALNVAADNPPAQALYRGLGYMHRYDYSYRVPPA